MDAPPVIDCEAVTRRFAMGGGEVWALRGVEVRVRRGEYVAIVGPSGSGKSTLMNILGCLDSPTGGHYRLDGEAVEKLSDAELAAERNRKIGFVFQTFNLMARQTAVDNVALPLVYSGVPRSERKARAREALDHVGLGDRLDHRPDQLSGGQRQRVAVARALVTHPSLILADEPTGNLDQTTGREVLQLFDELHRGGATIVLVTHDPAIARQAERRIEIVDGRVQADVAQRGATAASQAEVPLG
jgi:putative ABC transport system ATP-binding protein